MGAGDASPDAADLGSVDLTLGAVDESDALAEVELGVSSSLDTLDLDERDIGALVALSALESKNTTFSVKTGLIEIQCKQKKEGESREKGVDG